MVSADREPIRRSKSPDLLSCRVALLLSQNDAAVAAAARHPRGVNLMEVPDVERVEYPAVTRSQMEVVFILPANHSRVGGRHHVNPTGTKTPNHVSVHRIFVYIQTKAAHSSYARAGKISSIVASSAAISLSISSRLAW